MLKQITKIAEIRHLQDTILMAIPDALETDEAEALTDTLSLQSRLFPNRHVWLEFHEDGIHIDLEDWGVETEWDNTVATFLVDLNEQAIEIICAWCSGKKLSVVNSVSSSILAVLSQDNLDQLKALSKLQVTPNADTIEAMAELENGSGQLFKTNTELVADWGN